MKTKSTNAVQYALVAWLGFSGAVGCGNDGSSDRPAVVDVAAPDEDSGAQVQDDASTQGDGDGDTTPGDGDGDTTPGDGDGDGDTTPGDGDGDGDTTPGDGDGESKPVFLLTTSAYDEAFEEVTELVAVDLATKSLLWTSSPNDSDADLRESAGKVFVLGRNTDMLHMVSPRTGIVAELSLRVDAETSVGLVDIVVVPGSDTAFVSLAQANQIAVLDLASNSVSQRIDLADFVDPSDADGSAEPRRGFYSEATGLVYFLLNRHDYLAAWGTCPSFKNLLIAIDPETRTIVDINGAEAGTALALNLLNSYFISPVNAQSEITLMAGGCYSMATFAYVSGGLETLSLTTGSTTTSYVSPSDDPLQGFVVLGPALALVNRTDPGTFTATLWNRWDFASPSLGDAVFEVPGIPARESADSVVGVVVADGDDESVLQVRRRTLSTASTEVLVERAVIPFTSARSSAIVF